MTTTAAQLAWRRRREKALKCLTRVAEANNSPPPLPSFTFGDHRPLPPPPVTEKSFRWGSYPSFLPSFLPTSETDLSRLLLISPKQTAAAEETEEVGWGGLGSPPAFWDRPMLRQSRAVSTSLTHTHTYNERRVCRGEGSGLDPTENLFLFPSFPFSGAAAFMGLVGPHSSLGREKASGGPEFFSLSPRRC